MTVSKGLIGYEDVSFGTGTFKRKSRTGFDIDISKFSDLVDYLNGPIIDASRYSSFTTAIDAAAGKILLVSKPISLPSGFVTIPFTVSLWVLQSGVISKGLATSLTINGPIVGNPMHQIFSGFAAGEIIGLKKAKVEWFGAVADWTTDNSTALQLAFDWLTYGSNRTLKMQGRYRTNSMVSLYALTAIENSRNCTLDAYGAVIESYVNGIAVHIGKNGEETTGTTARFQYNTIKGLKIQAKAASVHTLLRIGGQYSYGSLYKDIRLFGYDSATRTMQGLLFFGKHHYYNNVVNIHVEDCDYGIMNGRDMNSDTYVDLSEPCNANIVNGAFLYNVGIHGIGLYNTAGNRFTNIDLEGGSTETSCRDVYFGKGATDNIVSARHERVNYNQSTGPYTHEFSDTSPTPTGNTAESNLHLIVLASAAVLRDNILIKLSSTNSGYDVNHIRTRYIYNHTDQPIAIRQNQFLAGEDAIMVDSSGVHVSNLMQSLTTPATAGATGVTGQIVWDNGFIYICTATNTWKKVAVSTW